LGDSIDSAAIMIIMIVYMRYHDRKPRVYVAHAY